MKQTLSSLQTYFQSYVLSRDTRVLNEIESTPDLPAQTRLDIYFDGYRARLADVLVDTYERVVAYIGEESFDAAARAYVETEPSFTRNLRDYGQQFPRFLETYFANDGEVAELALMDKILRYTFDAADVHPLTVKDVAGYQAEDWDSATFQLHSTACFVPFHWNTVEIWQQVSESNAPPVACRQAQPGIWFFWRKELQPHFRSLSAAEHYALAAIHEQRPFGEICQQLTERFADQDVTALVAVWLRAWLDEGMLKQGEIDPV